MFTTTITYFVLIITMFSHDALPNGNNDVYNMLYLTSLGNPKLLSRI